MMSMATDPIIYLLIFAGVFALIEGIYLTVFGKSISLNSKVNRRLEMLEKGSNREEVLEKLRKEMELHMASLGRQLVQEAVLTHRRAMDHAARAGGWRRRWRRRHRPPSRLPR